MFRDGEVAIRQLERGFAAETVRDPEGTVDYVAAKEGWDEFVQRVRMGRLNDEIAPTQISDEDALRICAKGAFSSIIHAANHIHDQEASGKGTSYDGAADGPSHPRALSILADAALEPLPPHLPMMRTDPSTHHRALLPQPSHAHTGGLPPFILPRPTPTQQPRRLLPARQQLGLGLGLPDPFAMNGPPQLPPPPGSNFARLPLPGYMPQGPAPSLYFPPPPGSHPPPPPRRF